MGWLPWSSSSSQSSPTVPPGAHTNPQESATLQNASSASSNRPPTSPLSSPSSPLEPVKDALISEENDPKPRTVFAEFMNRQAAPLVRPLAASPWPAYGVASLAFASAFKPGLGLPPTPAVLFSGAFATSAYVLQSGDVENGAGIFTWWAGSYLALRSLLKSRVERAARGGGTVVVRNPGTHALSAVVGVVGCAYAAEYFWFRKEDAVRRADRPLWTESG